MWRMSGEIVLNMQNVEGPVSMNELEEVKTALKYTKSGVVVEIMRAGGKGCLESLQ